ncbi:hypothetical protein AB0442_23150 [Kitasatospora sp. NPDC085895]|uniref:hypothetical protein n=1 Tax=Kitasatospora sp. NPDC085895 TaxID=3155057 RepID=UPI00344F43B3
MPPVLPGEGPALPEHLAGLLAEQSDIRLVVCEVASLTAPGPADLDRLARLSLVARRAGADLLLRGAGQRLQLLLALTGLAEALRCEDPSDTSGGAGGRQPHR